MGEGNSGVSERRRRKEGHKEKRGKEKKKGWNGWKCGKLRGKLVEK